jgi:hypothetical protein
MGGWPVWLASASLRNPRNGNVIPTTDWTPEQFIKVETSLDALLDGVGDSEREREFRMCVTLCRHRALTAGEHDSLPIDWHMEPAVDIAGGPIEVLWHRGIPETRATKPCENPGRQTIDSVQPWLYFPVDCGRCEPCRARAEATDAPCACATGVVS